MTAKPQIKLFAPKVNVRIGQWNVCTMFETGKCAQCSCRNVLHGCGEDKAEQLALVLDLELKSLKKFCQYQTFKFEFMIIIY